MYEDGQLEHELKVLRSAVKSMAKINAALSTVKITRTGFVVAYADLARELASREEMMKMYKKEGYF